jgi:hypothetical protein
MLLVMGLGPRFPDFPSYEGSVSIVGSVLLGVVFCLAFVVNCLQHVGRENWRWWVLKESVLKGPVETAT